MLAHSIFFLRFYCECVFFFSILKSFLCLIFGKKYKRKTDTNLLWTHQFALDISLFWHSLESIVAMAMPILVNPNLTVVSFLLGDGIPKCVRSDHFAFSHNPTRYRSLSIETLWCLHQYWQLEWYLFFRRLKNIRKLIWLKNELLINGYVYIFF